MRTGPMPDDPDGYEYTPAPAEVQTACRWRFEDFGITGVGTEPNTYLHGIGNFFDGAYTVRVLEDGSLSYTSPYSGDTDRFNADGYWRVNGDFVRWENA